jgi:hypothetical protein
VVEATADGERYASAAAAEKRGVNGNAAKLSLDPPVRQRPAATAGRGGQQVGEGVQHGGVGVSKLGAADQHGALLLPRQKERGGERERGGGGDIQPWTTKR